jgi:hypothetical protein
MWDNSTILLGPHWEIPGVPYFIYFLNKIILYGFSWFLGGCVFLFVKL